MFRQHRGRYGSPRIHRQLGRVGKGHGRKRVARIMRERGLVSRKKRGNLPTTRANPQHKQAPNLLNREFRADQPNRKWVSDITEIPTAEGVVYLAVTIDLYSRKVVGWAMDDTLEATLARRAFCMAIWCSKTSSATTSLVGRRYDVVSKNAESSSGRVSVGLKTS